MLNNQEISVPVLISNTWRDYPTIMSKYKATFGTYRCICGNKFTAMVRNIKSGDTKSCGCYKKLKFIESNTKHGLSRHPIYPIWSAMISRTTNRKNKKFKDYGGRGITVCERWGNVANFIDDMYPTYQKGLSIDRINNNGNYEPSNCRWTTCKTQSRNTRVIRSSNTSGYKGVHWHIKDKKWIANICIGGDHGHLGRFSTALEAAKAYDNYVIENNLEHTINGVFAK